MSESPQKGGFADVDLFAPLFCAALHCDGLRTLAWKKHGQSVMNHLTRHYGVTLLLSTATQPALPKMDKPREIISDPASLYAKLKRTDIFFPATLNEPTGWETLAHRLRQHDQVLCIVNTRSACHDLFCLMPEGTIHLSALMCGQHRSQVIASIKQRLRDGAPVRVNCTQLHKTPVLHFASLFIDCSC